MTLLLLLVPLIGVSGCLQAHSQNQELTAHDLPGVGAARSSSRQSLPVAACLRPICRPAALWGVELVVGGTGRRGALGMPPDASELCI
jgi:hypothetical protein